MNDLQIEYVPVEQLKPYENNARKHADEDVNAIVESIKEFGFDDPIGIWHDTIVEGHGRLIAAKKLGMETVPVIRLDHLTDEQRRAYALAHNRTAELSAWDFEMRDIEIEGIEIDMARFGFEVDDSFRQSEWFDREERDYGDTDGESDEYREFVEKFEGKKTTDDCYTPNEVYDAVADWVSKEYGVSRDKFIRPFYPGGDYQNEKYPKGCVVVDNPPFSILSEIIRFYSDKGVRFFLFAPALTLFTGWECKVEYIPVGSSITYENGATVSTSFINNLGSHRIRTAHDLYQAVKEANDAVLAERRKEIPKYSYPDEVITAATVARWSKYGVDFVLDADEVSDKISELDAQKETGKGIYGGGFLISADKAAEKAAAEKAAAVQWRLSEREREIVMSLGR